MSSIELELDFGLEDGETFEPEPLPEDFDRSRPHIETMLGPIEPAALGMTFFSTGIAIPEHGVDFDSMAVLDELEAAYATGLRSLVLTVDQISAEERERLEWLAARSPVHIVLLGAGERVQQSIGWATESGTTVYTIIERAERAPPDPAGILAGFLGPVETALITALNTLPLELMEAGMDARGVRTVLIDNPAAALTIHSGESE